MWLHSVPGTSEGIRRRRNNCFLLQRGWNGLGHQASTWVRDILPGSQAGPKTNVLFLIFLSMPPCTALQMPHSIAAPRNSKGNIEVRYVGLEGLLWLRLVVHMRVCKFDYLSILPFTSEFLLRTEP